MRAPFITSFTRIALCLGLAIAATGAPSRGGVISGTVHARGAPAAADEDAGDQYSSRRYKYLERVDYEELSDFIVFIDQKLDEPPSRRTARARIAQRDGVFVPRVLAVSAGTVVEFPNDDDIFHNVFSMSESTPFDLGLYKRGTKAKEVTMSRPGRVDLFCSIHTRMNGVIYVTPNSWFAKADERGRWELPPLPPGTYTVRAWHERMPSKAVEVVVPTEGDVTVEIVLGLGALPKA